MQLHSAYLYAVPGAFWVLGVDRHGLYALLIYCALRKTAVSAAATAHNPTNAMPTHWWHPLAAERKHRLQEGRARRVPLPAECS
jgi:hypothetical protein